MPTQPAYYAFCLLPVIVPVLFWAAYHWHADRHLPEPPGHLLLAFFLGIAAFYLGISLYSVLGLIGLRYDAYSLAESNLPGLYAYSVLGIGMIEESVKILPFMLVVLRFKEFDEPIDGIIYASFIALGFSALENIYYLDSLTTAQAYARGFAGPVVHIVFASIWGYYIGKAHLLGKPLLPVVLGSLGLTAVLHGTYDFIAIGLPTTALPFVALLIVGLWVWRLLLIRDLHFAAKQDSINR
jgi:RsiW-degrading membrane proteinase PrsW (M82 family)